VKKYQSLKGKKEFREVLSKGRRFYRSEVQLIALKISGNGYNSNALKRNNMNMMNDIRIAIQIGRRYGNAVTRNQAKRRIKAIYCELLQRVEDDFFIIMRPGYNFKSLNYLQSKEIIASLLVSAGVLKF
jgi:ribonuclease P protein component